MEKGYFGPFGGQFVSELLYPALQELEKAFETARKDKVFQHEFLRLLHEYAGRPTPLYFARNTSEFVGCNVYFKREDLLNGGSHKINNALGQALIAKSLGKKKIITETAAGMHGVATAMAANVVGLQCQVYMGVKDIQRQKSNAEKIKLLGAEVIPVERGAGVLKDAVSDALVAWIRDLPNTHYLIGSAVGPHPFPSMVSYFQKVIGDEARKQILKAESRLPRTVIACGSGGSNALGIFQAFVDDKNVDLMFVEGKESAAFKNGSIGVFQGSKSFVLQDEYGMDRKTESRAAGLNYPARGPQLSYLLSTGRLENTVASDKEVLDAYVSMAKLEGLLPAFETCHAIAELFKRKGQYKRDDVVILNFSGRGDKDMNAVISNIKNKTSKIQIKNKYI
jgi:tryptophan synthase beta chain